MRGPNGFGVWMTSVRPLRVDGRVAHVLHMMCMHTHAMRLKVAEFDWLGTWMVSGMVLDADNTMTV